MITVTKRNTFLTISCKNTAISSNSIIQSELKFWSDSNAFSLPVMQKVKRYECKIYIQNYKLIIPQIKHSLHNIHICTILCSIHGKIATYNDFLPFPKFLESIKLLSNKPYVHLPLSSNLKKMRLRLNDLKCPNTAFNLNSLEFMKYQHENGVTKVARFAVSRNADRTLKIKSGVCHQKSKITCVIFGRRPGRIIKTFQPVEKMSKRGFML